MKLKDLIKEYQEKTGYNNTKVAETFGVSKATVGRWISGEIEKVHGATAEKMTKILGYDVSKVINEDYAVFRKPILGMAKAGYDLFLDENYLGEEEVAYEDLARGDFFLKVTGDSMIGAGIKDGSLIFVKRMSQVDSGKIAVVQIGDEVTVKKIVYKGDTVILEAANPMVENRYFTKKDVLELPINVIGQVLYAKTIY